MNEMICRVIHLSDWTNTNELFNSWFSFAICEAVNTKPEIKTTLGTTKRPKTKTTSSFYSDPNH